MLTIGQPISIPDRFEGLRRRAKQELSSIIVPVGQSLSEIDRLYSEMSASGRGAFLVLRGSSGAGKSTFLHTAGMFRNGVDSVSIPPGVVIRDFLIENANPSAKMRIFVLEEREAAIGFSDQELETILHSINGFIRSDQGFNCLVVWPCNTDPLLDRVVTLAQAIGGESLLGTGTPAFRFTGPDKKDFIRIAETTIAVLNQGATFSDLGISSEISARMVEESPTIGNFLVRIRDEISKNEGYVKSLVAKEQCKLWIVVAAGTDPAQEVAALTRGRFAAVDIERLLSATEANIVKDLKDYPEKLGVLGTVLDAKIFHLPVITALAIMRGYANEVLRIRMKAANLATTPIDKPAAIARLQQTDLAQVFNLGAQGTMSPGKKIGSNTTEAFEKLAEIAASNDRALNRAVAECMIDAGLIKSGTLEVDFGKGMKRRTDLLCTSPAGEIVRIEIMWRSKTSRAEIANYALTKLYNYGKAIEFLT